IRTSRPTTKPAASSAFRKGVRKAPSVSGDRPLKYPITGTVFCACTASGQVATPPANTLRRSRRLIVAPEASIRDASNQRQRSERGRYHEASCPLWVKSRHVQCEKACPLSPQ